MHVWYGQAQKSRVSEGIPPRNFSKIRHSEITSDTLLRQTQTTSGVIKEGGKSGTSKSGKTCLPKMLKPQLCHFLLRKTDTQSVCQPGNDPKIKLPVAFPQVPAVLCSRCQHHSVPLSVSGCLDVGCQYLQQACCFLPIPQLNVQYKSDISPFMKEFTAKVFLSIASYFCFNCKTNWLF